jgi:UDP-3-O-[3-hydroxymyristoyl] glucosamine N-acyltransferase
VAGHIEIGDDAIVGAQAGVTKSISSGRWWSTPIVPFAEAKKHTAWLHRLGKLIDRVKAIEKKLGL